MISSTYEFGEKEGAGERGLGGAESAEFGHPGDLCVRRAQAQESAEQAATRRAIAELAAWVDDHGGDVDRSSFVKECDAVALLALHGMRVPRGALGRGLLTLDLACAMAGEYVPAALLQHGLPGREAWSADWEPGQ